MPFRDSKLTRLLKDSLGGSCRSIMIAAVSPAAPAGPNTYSTLRFASQARHILLPVSTGRALPGLGAAAWGRRVRGGCTGGCLPWGSPSPEVPLRAGDADGASAACACSAVKAAQPRARRDFAHGSRSLSTDRVPCSHPGALEAGGG